MGTGCSLWILRLVLVLFVLLCFKEATSATYYLDVTIVNLYGQNVRIIATVSNPKLKRFTIPTGGSYHINTTTFSNQSVFISSYDNATFKAIKTEGKNSISVTPSLTPVSLVYYVPSAPEQNSTTQAPVVSSTVAVSTTDPITSSQAPKQNPSTEATAVSSTDIASTTNSVTSPRGNAVTTNSPTTTDVSTNKSTDVVITKDAGLDNATTKALTQHPMTKVPVTIQDPTTNTSIQKDPTKSSKQDPNTNATTQADDGKDNKVVEDECKEEEYLVIIIVLAILVIILLVIVVCLVVYRATKNKKEKSGILYEKPNGKDQDMDENETRF